MLSELSILLVDDDEIILSGFKALLRTAAAKNVPTISDSRKVMPFLAEHPVDVILLDLSMAHIPGLELLKTIKAEYPNISVIVVTGDGGLETAVECMKSGAYDYLVKPVEMRRFISCIEKAGEVSFLRRQLSSMKRSLLEGKLKNEKIFSPIVTKSEKMFFIFKYIEVVALSPQPVLIYGETGTGKELAAKAVHDASQRKGHFLEINVAGLDDHMFSDTLFGHVRGAYTGADRARAGLIEKAKGGTLFLDEIGDLNEASQIKLLRLLQDQTYYPLGSDIPNKSDVRIVAATNKNLKEQVAEGNFRKDLYYRLGGHSIELPPLKERVEDIPLLAEHFLSRSARAMKVKKPTAPPELYTLLKTHNFPGNIRELEAMIFDAVAQHEGGVLSTASFRKTILKDNLPPAKKKTEVALTLEIDGRLATMKELEDFLIKKAMKRAGNNQRVAADIMGISRQTLNKKLTRKRPKIQPS